jgi:hypothetical protein
VRLTGAVLQHQLHELAEEVIGVVGAGAGFRVILHGKQGQVTVADPGHGTVIQVEVGDYATPSAGIESASTANPWFWLVISTCLSSPQGWLRPRWPNLSL